jgi:hypothetical protein
MMITGPLIRKTVTVPEHDERVLDEGAYWNLDFDGEPLAEGEPLTLLYARVAFPTLAAAQHQFRIERQAQAERSRPRPRPRPARGGQRAR